MASQSSTLIQWVRSLTLASPLVFATYLIRFDVAGIPLTLLEVLTYFLFALWFLALIQKKVTLNWSKRVKNYSLFIFLLLVAATIGVLVTPHTILLPGDTLLDAQKQALGVWKGWIVAPILYFVVLTQVIKTKADTDKLLHMFIYSAVAVSLIAYALALFANGLTYDMRLSGFYESANYLSLYIAPAIVLASYYILQKTGKKQHLIDVASLTVMVHTLFFTQSYAAILAIFGTLILYVLYAGIKYFGSIKKAISWALALLLVFVAITATQFNSRKFQQFLDFENRSSTSVRLEIYEASYKMLKRYPLAGHGLGVYQARYQTDGRELLERIPMEWNIPHPHNVFLAFWLNTGLLGFLAFLVILLLAHTKFTYPILALWVTLIHGVFDTPFWKNDLAMIFWLIIASIVVLQNTNAKDRGSIAAKKPKSAAKRKPVRSAKRSTSKRKPKAAK